MSVRVILLAAQRRGVVDPLALAHGVSHKCLVPLHGVPLIRHALTTIARHAAISDICVSVEPELFDTIARIAAGIPDKTATIDMVAAADNLADSVIAAAAGHGGPLVITTADNALLTPAALDSLIAPLKHGHDLAIAMTTKQAVQAAHPLGQRRFYRFRDGDYCNCNLYGMAGPHALAAAEIFRGGGQFAKKASRIIDAFGLMNLVLLRLRLLSLPAGLKRIASRFGLTIAPVILREGRCAIDVDNERTYAIVDSLLMEQRRAA